MEGEQTINELQLDTAPKKSVWRLLRENPYISGLSLVWRPFSYPVSNRSSARLTLRD